MRTKNEEKLKSECNLPRLLYAMLSKVLTCFFFVDAHDVEIFFSSLADLTLRLGIYYMAVFILIVATLSIAMILLKSCTIFPFSFHICYHLHRALSI